MEAKSLKNGNKIYLFNRGEATLEEAKVVSVSVPHFDARAGSSASLVVDVTVEAGAETRTYTMRDSADVSFVGNLTVCTGKESLLREVEGIKQQAEQTLDQVDKLKQIVVRCRELLTDMNPAEKERVEMEKWKSGMEADMRDMKGMLSSLIRELKGGEHE